ncbi:MAG: mechanosensitive ion channel family protein [Opitutales bacterium]|nr:mechanosensitive ion channel family protein [Opitutales bacterium]
MPDLTTVLQTAAIVLIILLLGVLAMSFLIRALDLAGSRAGVPALVLQPMRNVVKLLVALIVMTLVLGQFGIELMSILTATVALVAIGFFAVWSLVSHVTATILLVIVKPFNMNDTVNFAGEEVKGKVVDINLFYTSLETEDGDRFQVPNNLFFQKTLRRSFAPAGQQADIGARLGE